jgi:hypothetical protein
MATDPEDPFRYVNIARTESGCARDAVFPSDRVDAQKFDASLVMVPQRRRTL